MKSRTMKTSRFVIICGVAAMLAGPVLAHPKQMAPEAQAERMQKVLQLDDKQRSEVSAILARAAEQRQAAAQKYTIAERQAFRTEMRDLHKETREAIGAVLTEPQKNAMKALHERRGKPGKEGKRRPHHADRSHSQTKT